MLDAAGVGDIDLVELLLERGMDINARNASNQTPLYRAAAQGNVDVVLLLIEWGIGIHVISGGGPHCTSHHDTDASRSRGFFSITAQMRTQGSGTTGLRCTSQQPTDTSILSSCYLNVARTYMR